MNRCGELEYRLVCTTTKQKKIKCILSRQLAQVEGVEVVGEVHAWTGGTWVVPCYCDP